MTLRQLDALIRRKNANDEAQDLRFGLIAAVLVKLLGDPKKTRDIKPSDFFRRKPKRKSVQTIEQQINILEAAARIQEKNGRNR